MKYIIIEFLPPSFCHLSGGVTFFSLLLLLNLTVLTGGNRRCRKDKEYTNRAEVRCAGSSDGDTTASFLLITINLFFYFASFLYLYSLRPYSFTIL
jgi:hypothetical protein